MYYNDQDLLRSFENNLFCPVIPIRINLMRAQGYSDYDVFLENDEGSRV